MRGPLSAGGQRSADFVVLIEPQKARVFSLTKLSLRPKRRPEAKGANLSGSARSGREDATLLGEVCAGQVEALAELYRRYGDRAYRLAMSVCRDPGCAETAVQEAFASLWSRPPARSQRASVAACVLGSVCDRAIDAVRRRARSADNLPPALAALPDPQLEVIALAHYGQLSHTEIADWLGIPAATVKGRMWLGLNELRSDLEQHAV